MTDRVDFAEIIALVPMLDDDELRLLAARVSEEAKAQGLVPRRRAATDDPHLK
jgi:hypothetical protein